MTHASEAQDQTEAPEPAARGWFQPPSRPAESGEPPAAVQAPVTGAAPASASELPTVVQAPAARPSVPKFPLGDRPADITRPQLILDDTVVDIGGAPAGTSSPPADKPSGKRSRSVFGPEPASRPDMLTDAETVVMPSLKGSKGKAAGQSGQADDGATANARNAAAVRHQAITAMLPVGTSAAFAEAVTQILPTVEPSELPPGPMRRRPGTPA